MSMCTHEMTYYTATSLTGLKFRSMYRVCKKCKVVEIDVGPPGEKIWRDMSFERFMGSLLKGVLEEDAP